MKDEKFLKYERIELLICKKKTDLYVSVSGTRIRYTKTCVSH